PDDQRRAMLRHPPEILITTPESLNILLTGSQSRQLFGELKTVILDEIHAVLDSKRGAFLACQIGALSLLAGEFRRVALSATVRPPETAAAFVGGLRKVTAAGGRPGFRYEPRPVSVVAPPAEKRIDLAVEYPEPPPPDPEAGPGLPESSRYGVLVDTLAGRIRKNRSTLVFTDSRRRAERIAFLLNEKAGAGSAYAHHGSLSKEVRRLVEERLKRGELPCVVATGSLELGIDVGSVDEVVLAGSPPAVSPALQRVGRSGHGVGRTSRGLLFPFHGMDLLRAAALAGAVRDREIEPLSPVENPLDILAQTVLALCAAEDRGVDALYEDIRTFPPFRDLSREAYDRVVEVLAGRYESARLRELKPRLRYDRISGT
ncbi:MAG TPA: helicase-related protein, partial [Spirochaetia bacterium]|nr:helicase-related protein [Spirochaetia bacterium]